jgi:hypothetical protein
MIQFKLDYITDSTCFECLDTIRGIGFYDNQMNTYCEICGVEAEAFQLLTESRY